MLSAVWKATNGDGEVTFRLKWYLLLCHTVGHEGRRAFLTGWNTREVTFSLHSIQTVYTANPDQSMLDNYNDNVKISHAGVKFIYSVLPKCNYVKTCSLYHKLGATAIPDTFETKTVWFCLQSIYIYMHSDQLAMYLSWNILSVHDMLLVIAFELLVSSY